MIFVMYFFVLGFCEDYGCSMEPIQPCQVKSYSSYIAAPVPLGNISCWPNTKATVTISLHSVLLVEHHKIIIVTDLDLN